MICAGLGSVMVAVFLILLKIVAFLGTGSVSILSSLFDSVQDFMTSLINMISIHQAVQPPDKAHRFGHGKAQGIGSLLQAFIISVSAVLLLIESISHLLHSGQIQQVFLGIVVTVVALCMTMVLVFFQNYVIQRTESLSIKADRAHYTGDILMNIGVLVSLCLSAYLGWLWVDGVFGVFVSFYLIYAVWHVMKEACAMLMDKELSKELREKIKSLTLSVPLVKNVSSLKTREGGNKRFVQFNAQFDGEISLNKAHHQLDLIEQVIQAEYPDMEVIIHAEPYDIAKQKKEKK